MHTSGYRPGGWDPPRVQSSKSVGSETNRGIRRKKSSFAFLLIHWIIFLLQSCRSETIGLNLKEKIKLSFVNMHLQRKPQWFNNLVEEVKEVKHLRI